VAIGGGGGASDELEKSDLETTNLKHLMHLMPSKSVTKLPFYV
jgi:hypothetical protein